MWDLIVSVPDHCLSFYFSEKDIRFPTIQWRKVPPDRLKPPSILILTVPRRYFCCGSLLLLVLTFRIYTLVHLLYECHILVTFG